MPSLTLTRLLMNAYASSQERWRRSCAFSQQAGRRQGAEKPIQILCLPAAREGGISENGMPSPTLTRLFMNAYASHKKRSRKSCACFDPLAANANCLQICPLGNKLNFSFSGSFFSPPPPTNNVDSRQVFFLSIRASVPCCPNIVLRGRGSSKLKLSLLTG
jgi:hypothetical protein